jgi:small-conductance mechanosensitive channel
MTRRWALPRKDGVLEVDWRQFVPGLGSSWFTDARLFAVVTVTTGLKLLGIFVLYLFTQRLMARLVDRLVPPLLSRVRPEAQVSESRTRTISGLLKSIGHYVLLFIAAVMALQVLGLEVAPIIASAGVVGLAVGFGAQKLVRDVITGFLILVEDQFAVGDTITIGGNTGVVEEMGMRITRLRDEVGKLVILSNGDISTVVNHTRGPLSVTVDVSVTPETGLEQLRDLVAGLVLPKEMWAEAPAVRGVVAMDAAKLTVRVVGRAQPGQQTAAELTLRQLLREALTGAGIKLA